MTQTLNSYLDLRHVSGVLGGDIEMNNISPGRGFEPGMTTFLYDKFGPRWLRLVQNKASATLTRGTVVSQLGDVNGLTVLTASTGTTTSVSHLSAALAINAHVGAIAVAGSAGTGTIDGESSIVVSNSSTAVNFDTRYPFSAAIAASTIVNLRSVWGVEAASTGDTNETCLGVLIGQNGLSSGRYGFTQFKGISPRVNKNALGALTAGLPLVVGTGGTGVVSSAGVGTVFNLAIGSVHMPASSSASQCIAQLACGGLAQVGQGTAAIQ